MEILNEPIMVGMSGYFHDLITSKLANVSCVAPGVVVKDGEHFQSVRFRFHGEIARRVGEFGKIVSETCTRTLTEEDVKHVVVHLAALVARSKKDAKSWDKIVEKMSLLYNNEAPDVMS